MNRAASGSAAVVAFLIASCAPYTVDLPAPASPEPTPPAQPGLQAGFGRADITPPPGLGIQAYGPSGSVANGFRTRLYARAVFLEDADGERVALVALDLAHASVLLHRNVAARTLETGIGADRLLLGATHTHAGPGHFMSDEAINKYGPARPGFDPAVVDFLAERITRAVREAAADMRPAVVGWVQGQVWGLTRNRSMTAHRMNPEVPGRPVPPPGLPEDQGAIDPTWTLLRIDTIDTAGDTIPGAAISVFGFHATGNPAANDLYDGDVPAIIERDLEQYMDALAGATPTHAPRSVHLFFNGSEGDASLVGMSRSACPPAKQLRGVRPGGPRSPRSNDYWKGPSAAPASECVQQARQLINGAGDSLAAHARDLYREAGSRLTSDVAVGRAFRSYDLSAERPEGLCPEPVIGRGSGGGAEDGKSALYDWRIFGFVDIEAREGVVDEDSQDCQAPKKSLHWLLKLLVGPLALSETLQLQVVRVGDLLPAGLPAAPTAEVGFRIRDAMLESAAGSIDVHGAAVVGQSNGYVQYLATAEEYSVQHYEGGSTLYGPGSAGALEAVIADLVATLPDGGEALVLPLTVEPGKPHHIFPEAEESAGAGRGPLRVESSGCSRDTAVVRWHDDRPGTLLPSDGPILELARTDGPGGDVSVWDDDREVEIRALGSRVGRGYLWEARWTPPAGTSGRYEATFLRWSGPGNTREWECR
jgi:neutral ceramidase